MKVNYEGVRLQKEWLKNALTQNMNRRKDEYDKEFVASWDNNPFKYAYLRFRSEKLKSGSIPIKYIEDWLYGVAVAEIPVEAHLQLELRDKWGYTTKDEKWCNNFMTWVASRLASQWQKENYYE